MYGMSNPLKVTPPTIRLTEAQIKEAIKGWLRERNYIAEDVALAATPHQRNGPDTFEAVATLVWISAAETE
jgi:hypothetical protein